MSESHDLALGELKQKGGILRLLEMDEEEGNEPVMADRLVKIEWEDDELLVELTDEEDDMGDDDSSGDEGEAEADDASDYEGEPKEISEIERLKRQLQLSRQGNMRLREQVQRLESQLRKGVADKGRGERLNKEQDQEHKSALELANAVSSAVDEEHICGVATPTTSTRLSSKKVPSPSASVTSFVSSTSSSGTEGSKEVAGAGPSLPSDGDRKRKIEGDLDEIHVFDSKRPRKENTSPAIPRITRSTRFSTTRASSIKTNEGSPVHPPPPPEKTENADKNKSVQHGIRQPDPLVSIADYYCLCGRRFPKRKGIGMHIRQLIGISITPSTPPMPKQRRSAPKRRSIV